MHKRAVFALTAQGAELARGMAAGLQADVYLPRALAGAQDMGFANFHAAVGQAWTAYSQLVFVAASGIAVRTIAPLLQGKDRDPAVVVVDHQGRFAVSLISGHLGGANDLARETASLTGGQAVITTATDSLGLLAIDCIARSKEMGLEPVSGIKKINAALLQGEPVRVADPEDRLGWKDGPPAGYTLEQSDPGCGPLVKVEWREDAGSEADLILRPRCLVAGMGCNTQTSGREIQALIRHAFAVNNLSLASLHCLVSTSKKAQEPGLLQAADALGISLVCIEHRLLQDVDVPNPSATVHNHMGVSSICEAAAILHTNHGRLLVPKTKSRNATLAVALQP
ncbi:cobalt-precorrin 5A hydrolase [Desulfovermiculus halophilus]|uniref:cobalt-precorrin 5A hydrolase n=1 Tax=Desulfovermiculus halophilus TaxID=339722 RepID=UPI000486B5E5|nr:cobalamin biosynthesis protein [Desulfovermiculus halophilus]